jgi:ubiquitin-protein ligase
MSSTFSKRIHKEIQLYKKENFIFPNLIVQPSEDLHLWYFIIYDLKDTDYENGIYLGKVTLPTNYPFKAPDFIFLTENGRFELNRRICTSFTGFHQDTYSASWNVVRLCSALISFMTDNDKAPESQGIGGIFCSKEKRQEIAIKSREIIKNNDIVKKYFSEYFQTLHI